MFRRAASSVMEQFSDTSPSPSIWRSRKPVNFFPGALNQRVDLVGEKPDAAGEIVDVVVPEQRLAGDELAHRLLGQEEDGAAAPGGQGGDIVRLIVEQSGGAEQVGLRQHTDHQFPVPLGHQHPAGQHGRQFFSELIGGVYDIALGKLPFLPGNFLQQQVQPLRCVAVEQRGSGQRFQFLWSQHGTPRKSVSYDTNIGQV